MKRDTERGKGVEKMCRGECGPLETASSVVAMQAVAEHTDAVLKEKHVWLLCNIKRFVTIQYETESVSDDLTPFTPHIIALYLSLM